MNIRNTALAGAAALALAVTPAAALAQDTLTDPGLTTTTPAQEEDDDFPWGLLGLLGLAGLLGLKGRDRDHDDYDRRTTTTPPPRT